MLPKARFYKRISTSKTRLDSKLHPFDRRIARYNIRKLGNCGVGNRAKWYTRSSPALRTQHQLTPQSYIDVTTAPDSTNRTATTYLRPSVKRP